MIEDKNNSDKLMNRNDVMKLLGISAVTLLKWEKKGLIVKHKLQRRNFYLKDEIMAAIKAN